MTTVLAVALSLDFLPLRLAMPAVAPVIRRAAAHLDMSVRLYGVIGTPEVAGAAGLLLGPASAPLGLAATAGPVLHMVAGAVLHCGAGAGPVGRCLPQYWF
ncbi:DoxX family protein [Streptomyces sp. NPDC057280]|uniref:DoxX family protein n=1 Tax=Streptomyces sp. NPDC057280 TaxID=3346081 RepID=UPI0026D4D17D